MKTTYKPTEHNAVSPYLVVNQSEELLDFMIKTFTATEMARYDNSDGSIMHAEVKIDDSIIMLTTASEDFPANNSFIHVYVKDAKEVFAMAIKNGALAVQPPVIAEGDSDMRGMFTDPFGNVWAVATHFVNE